MKKIMKKIIKLLFMIPIMGFISCGEQEDSMDIIHSIKVYQLDLPSNTISGDCSGTAGIIRYDGEFHIEIDVKSTIDDEFEFNLNLPIDYTISTRERLGTDMYGGVKYICYEDTTEYVVSLVYPDDLSKPGGIFWIVDWNNTSILLLVDERIK